MFMENRRVLMIGWEYPPNNSGGLGVACQGIVENLVDQGEEILLVLPSQDIARVDFINDFSTQSGKKYKVMYVHSPLRPYAGRDGKKYSGDLIADVESFARKVLAAVKNEDFDIIHVHDWLTVPAGIKIKESSGKPLVMHVHSTEYDRTAGGDPNVVVSNIENKGFEEADMIITVSKYTKSLLIN